jgi:hypothetical protein
MKSTNTVWKKGKEGEGKQDYNEGGKLVQGAMYVWNYHNEILSYY